MHLKQDNTVRGVRTPRATIIIHEHGDDAFFSRPFRSADCVRCARTHRRVADAYACLLSHRPVLTVFSFFLCMRACARVVGLSLSLDARTYAAVDVATDNSAVARTIRRLTDCSATECCGVHKSEM